MDTKCLAFWLLGWTISATAAPLNYSSVIAEGTTVSATAVDSAGNVYLAGSTTSPSLPVTPNAFQKTFVQAQCGVETLSSDPTGGPPVLIPIPCAHAFVAKINPAANDLVYLTYLGGEGNDGVSAITVDSAGNSYVTGNTTSLKFPVTLSAYRAEPGSAFVAKFSPDGSQLLFSTYFDGVAPSAIALDPERNVYVAGSTGFSGVFTTTPGAFQSAVAGDQDAFVAKFNASGTALIYSTWIGGTLEDVANALAVDAEGNAYVAGYTGSLPANVKFAPSGPYQAFPMTAGAFTALKGEVAVFVTKLNPSGTALVYSAVFGGSGSDVISAIALDASGSVYFAGYTPYSPDFPTTTGAFQTAYGGGFAGKVSPDGSRLLYSTYLGASTRDSVSTITVDSAGAAYVSGASGSPRFSTTPDSLQPCFPASNDTDYSTYPFVAKLNASGSKLLYGSFLNTAAVVFDSAGNVYLAGVSSILQQFNVNAPPAPGLRCMVNAADYWGTAVAPGEIVSLFGSAIGPDQPAGAQRDNTGKIASTLAGTRVLFNGIPAPLLYVSPSQINAVVPFGVAGQTRASVQIERNGVADLPTFPVVMVDASPAVFTLDRYGQAAVLNQDGTVNSISHPAPPGSVIAIFMTGAGDMLPRPVDGYIPAKPSAKPLLPVIVQIPAGLSQAEVLYTGDAPGLVEGAVQIDVRLPPNTPAGEATLGVTAGNTFNPAAVPVIVAIR